MKDEGKKRNDTHTHTHTQLIKNCTLTVGYSLGMVKIEAFDIRHFMHQTVIEPDHTYSFITGIA